MKRPHCYVSTRRRARGLTQPELAFLLGWESGSPVSLLERGREPLLHKALLLEIVFGIDSASLFPTLAIAAEEELARRAYELRQRLKPNPSKANQVKIELLDQILARVLERVKQREA